MSYDVSFGTQMMLCWKMMLSLRVKKCQIYMLKVGLRAKMICSPQIYIIGKVVFKYLYLLLFFFICFYSLQSIKKTCLFKYIENFTTKN